MSAFLDTKGLSCPLPVLKTRKAIQDVPPGETLTVEATDPGSMKDFEAFCRVTGHELLESGEQGGVYRYVIRKAG